MSFHPSFPCFQTALSSPFGEVLLYWREPGILLGLSVCGPCAGKVETLIGGPFQRRSFCPLPVAKQLEEYAAGTRRQFELPWEFCCGTPFQRAVWQALTQIPYGTVCTYAQLAQMAHVSGCRAVGNAVGRNPLPLLIPCHRVLPASGGVGQYSCGDGPALKRRLLKLEGISLPDEFH